MRSVQNLALLVDDFTGLRWVGLARAVKEL